MKKFINRPENAVEEMLEGFVVLNPDLTRLSGHKVLVRKDVHAVSKHQVALISGGGSGHEPAHAGYVGCGMLTAAVAGEIFTSPDSDSIYAAIKTVSGPRGALLIVKNYTGDLLNFGVAAESARSEGISVEMIIVDDDVALAKESRTGARGLAGTVLIHKIVGAAAAEGRSLAEVKAIGKAAIDRLATMGVSLSAGTSPLVGKPSFELGADEMELGLGIHGEPGLIRTKIRPADELVEFLLTEILKQDRFGPDKRVAVMINNLGSATSMEFAIIARRLMALLQMQGFKVERAYAGTFLSSLDMAGVSISVLGVDDDRVRWLDAPTAASAWPNVVKHPPGDIEHQIEISTDRQAMPVARKTVVTERGKLVRRTINAACDALIVAEPELTEMDRITGDGDLGASMKRAGIAMKAAAECYPVDDLAATLKEIGHSLRRELGGSSGPLYGVLFLRAGSLLQSEPNNYVASFEAALAAVSELGGAKPGDRTMLDALYPFVNALRKAKLSGEVFREAVSEAARGAESTAQMKPKLGRSSYLGDRVLGHPDPGAQAVAIWLNAIAQALFPTS